MLHGISADVRTDLVSVMRAHNAGRAADACDLDEIRDGADMAAMGMDAVEATLKAGRATCRDRAWPDPSPTEIALIGRGEEIRVEQFRAEIAAVDDPETVAARLDAVREARDEIAGSDRRWDQCERNSAAYGALLAAEAACEERLVALASAR